MTDRDTPADLIYRLATSRTTDDTLDRIALLEAARDAAPAAELAATYDGARATVYRALGQLVEVGFVAETDPDGYRTTRAGMKASLAYQQVADRVGDETLAYLAGSSLRRDLIRQLHASARSKSELAAGDAAPARSTIQRTLRGYDERGWLREPAPGTFRVTEAATETLEEYEQLATAIEQAIEKEPCLRQLADWADPPLSLLEGTELIVETSDDPHALLEGAIKAAELRENGLTRLRSIVPLFDPVTYDLFADHIDPDATFDVIFDQAAYQELTRPGNIHYLTTALLAPSVNVRIHPEPLYTGLGIYNETVLLGGSTRHERKAGVMGDDEALYEWAVETFEEMWEASETPTRRLHRWLERSVPASLSGSI